VPLYTDVGENGVGRMERGRDEAAGEKIARGYTAVKDSIHDEGCNTEE
jgi:hypothetical protein